MADVIVTIKIMPESPEVDLSGIESKAVQAIESFGGKGMKAEQEPVAFGLKSLNITFVMDEDKGDTEPLEKDLAGIEGVNSAETSEVRRALG